MEYRKKILPGRYHNFTGRQDIDCLMLSYQLLAIEFRGKLSSSEYITQRQETRLSETGSFRERFTTGHVLAILF